MKKFFKYLGVLFLLLLVVCVSLYFYLMPLFDELGAVSFDIYGLRFGKGWHSYSASSTSNMGSINCEGYHWLMFCISEHELYCKYFEPFRPMDTCLCESVTDYYKGSYRRYCEKNKQCYTNSWEYEFGCASDLLFVCDSRERDLGTMPSCYHCMDPFITKCSECNKSWTERYSESTPSMRVEIFNREDFSKNPSPISDRIFIKPLCTLICNNCNSSLCSAGNLCEYAVNPLNNSISP